MKKTYLSCILFILTIILSGCTLAEKGSVTEKLPPIGAKVYQKNSILFQKNDVLFQKDIPKANAQNIIKNINKNEKINILDSKKKQPVVQTSFKQGDNGSKVKDIQVKLNKFGYKLYADGNFGVLTYYAVMDFQVKNKLPKDGIIGASTLEKINLTPTSETMYKEPIYKKPIYKKPIYKKPLIQKSIPKATTPGNDLEKFANSKNFSSSTTYFIWIDLSRQKVNIFEGSNKKWNLVKSMLCSSGKASTPTVKGSFNVGSKGSYFISSGGARCKYYTQIRGNYLFHSILYDRKGNYIIDNTLGSAVSHGCVRLALNNAKFIYDNIPAKTLIWSN